MAKLLWMVFVLDWQTVVCQLRARGLKTQEEAVQGCLMTNLSTPAFVSHHKIPPGGFRPLNPEVGFDSQGVVESQFFRFCGSSAKNRSKRLQR